LQDENWASNKRGVDLPWWALARGNPWKEEEMGKEAVIRKAPEMREEIRRFAEQLRQKVYAEKAYPDWGTLFSEIEELGVQIGDAVCREFVGQAVSEQAHAPEGRGPEVHCPTCGGPLQPRDAEPRPLLTRRGEVHWQEPQGYCRKCRKAFFPAVQKFGSSG
jgi:hypothetical protein